MKADEQMYPDVLSVHVPLTESTRGLIGAEQIARMKRSAILVNAARGGVVDEDALAAALQAGQLAGAALDVYATEPLPADHPLRALSNTVLTPHLGAATEEAQHAVAVEIAEGTRLPFTVHGCSPGRGTATVNGSFANGEWQCANTFNFTASVSGGSTPATLYVMNDATNLYLAVRLQRSGSDKVNTLQFNFDNNNSWTLTGLGAAETGDDILSLDAAKGFTDAFLTLKCVNSSQSSCWGTDVSGGGTAEGSGAVTNDGTYTTYEVSHPLNSADDAHDYSLAAGSKVGVFLTLQTGSGATGNTQWPQFREFLEIVVQP